MKILALADRKITQNLVEIVNKNSIDLVILLGDLKYHEIQDLEDVKIPVIGVLGNHCSFNYLPKLNALDAHLTSHHILGLYFFGFRGCPYYKGGEFESSQEDCSKDLAIHGGPCDILLAHSPAAGINSSGSPHEGFLGLTTFLENHNPKIFFHGHSYPSKEQKISKFRETIVYFVEGLEIIDTTDLLEMKDLPLAQTY